ncbi:DNA repair exonuclease SbcCD nuclease subunit [Halohasta litchfieldiae]|jgi:DNA repair exonuclease SbcCD nuclease subunit|uniref:DNA double-strand break repair protein Mre11 n=1 Tax=Halohasta litchfieldiae TaxID=1073996 RepID=A0A1H6T306_9EURY|nr:DNA double-strand break repair protein Mre11 [Halohasta litchfieldiae]ATW87762.1 DNA repair exonuclease SbcCD nuclease subunit [Halohasta litchfieldiae]SEI74428.1 DNA repair exonuclease SbcCD nuclease subunit [Halohasta litchfieldiae]
MTRVIHTGDTHIGYQQYHSAARRQDFLDAFEAVIDDAIEMDVAAVIHAGDLFHDRRPELPDLLGTLTALRRLAEADIPFLAVVGNHESTRGGQWLDLFEQMGLATRLGPDPVVVDSVAIYGLDHVPVSRREDLDYEFTPPSDDTSKSILVSHGLFTPFAHANWETETVLKESNIEFNAVLLGDNHEAGVEQVDGTWVTYCGSTERASASERDGRGYNVVEFDAEMAGTAGVDIRQRSLSTRPFVFVSVDLAEGEGSSRVREQVRQHELTDAVVSVELLGDGEQVTPASIEEFALDRGALIARVTDRREIETETELSVSFADPDAAVDEKVRDLGLSSTALGIDETVRASKIADSNVRKQVEQLVDGAFDDEPTDDESTADEPADEQPETDTAEDQTDGSDPATDGQLSLEDLQ